MKNKKLPKDKYTAKRYEDLHCAVAYHGSSLHREFFDLMVDAGFSKKKIFTKYMRMLRSTSKINHAILKSVGAEHFAFELKK